jgi:hypothetical protein
MVGGYGILLLLLLLLVLLGGLRGARAATFGELAVAGATPPGGTALHLVGNAWQQRFISVSDGGRKLTLTGGGGLQLGATATAGVGEPSGYYQWMLLGNALSYTVDLSNVGCSCNAALYFVSMPGYNVSSGSVPDPRSSYYCGANAGKPSLNTSATGGRGNYCPEMDVLEANAFAAQSTPHICNGTNHGPGFYPMCDHHGCATAVYNQSKTAMCMSEACTIDTRRPFRHTVSFPLAAGTGALASISNVFEQEGRSFDFQSCAGDVNAQWTGGSSSAYLHEMQLNLARGMVMDISLWGLSNSGMSWLDGPTGCQGDCNVSGSRVSFSNLTLQRL